MLHMQLSIAATDESVCECEQRGEQCSDASLQRGRSAAARLTADRCCECEQRGD